MTITIGDLQKDNGPPPPATRREIAQALDKVQHSFALLYDCLNSVNELIDDARAVLARGDDDQPAVPSDSAEEPVALP